MLQAEITPRVAERQAKRPTAVVLGLQQNGLGVVRALAREGVNCIAVDGDPTSSWTATRHCREVVPCPDFNGPGLIDTLCELGSRLDAPGILIPTMDHTVLLVSEHRARLEEHFVHSLPGDDVIQQLMSKATTYDFAIANGYRMPRTFVVNSDEDLEQCLSQIQMPCILKPQVKTRGFLEHRTAKAFFLHTIGQVRENYRILAQGEPRVVVQEWIPGPDANLIFCLYYFDADGAPLGIFEGRKIRQHIPDCGTACSAEPWPDAYVRESGIRFFQAAGYRGLGAIEFKVDSRDGSYHLMEPTVGRTEHLFALAAANGVNLPYLAYCDMAKLPLPRVEQSKSVVKYVDWKRDWQAARIYHRRGDLSLREWSKIFWGRKQYSLFSLSDPGPWLHATFVKPARRVRNKSKKICRRLFGGN